MPYLTLTLDGQLVDLPPDAQVALSYRANDLTNLDGREAPFSEQFTLPLTARNAAVLGVPHALDSQTRSPYRLLPAMLASPGGAVLLQGFAILEQAGDGYDVTLTDAVGGLFAQVGDKELRAVNLSAHDHLYSRASVEAAQGAAGAYTYPLTNDGRLSRRYPEAGVATVHYTELAPAVFSYAILAAVVADALPGYRVSGSLLREPLFRRHQLLGGSARRRAAYLKANTLQASTATDRTYATIQAQGVATDLTFDAILSDPGAHAAAVAPEGTAYRLAEHVADYRVQLALDVTFAGTGGPYVGTQRVAVVVSENGLGFAEEVIYEGTWSAATQPQMRRVRLDTTFRRVGASGTIRVQIVPQNRMQVTVAKGSQLTVTPLPRAYDNSSVHLDAGLPDISQADFLQLVLNTFNAIPQVDTGQKLVRFDLLNDLERNRARAVDWSDRLDYGPRPVLRYRLDGLAARNTFAYAPSPAAYEALDAPSEAETPALRITGDATLPALNEAYEAPLARLRDAPAVQATARLPLLAEYGQEAATLFSLWRPAIAFSIDFFVLDQGRYWQAKQKIDATYPRPGTDPAFWRLANESEVFGTAAENDGFVGLYTELAAPAGLTVGAGNGEPGFAPTAGLASDGLGFEELLPAYYEGLRRALQRGKALTVPLRLTPIDVQGLDFTVPVRLNVPHVPGYGQLTGLFYLNTIDQYQPGRNGSVPVTLLLLGDSVPGLAPAVTVPIAPPGGRRALLLETGDPLLLETGDPILLES